MKRRKKPDEGGHGETVKRCFDELWDAGFKLKDLWVLEDTIHDTHEIS